VSDKLNQNTLKQHSVHFANSSFRSILNASIIRIVSFRWKSVTYVADRDKGNRRFIRLQRPIS